MNETATTTYASFDWPALVQKLSGDVTFARALLAVAQRSTAAMPAELRVAASGSDFEAMARLAHKLKGTAGDICAGCVREQAAAAELSARQAAPEASGQLRVLADSVERLLLDLQAAVAAVP